MVPTRCLSVMQRTSWMSLARRPAFRSAAVWRSKALMHVAFQPWGQPGGKAEEGRGTEGITLPFGHQPVRTQRGLSVLGDPSEGAGLLAPLAAWPFSVQ